MGQSVSTSDRTLNGQIRKMAPGESFEAVLSYADFPATGFTCNVNFIGNGFASPVTCTKNADGISFDLAVHPTVTKKWGWGPASAQAIMTGIPPATSVKVVEMICFTVMPDPTKITAEMNALAAIEAVLAGRAADDQLTTSLDGVQLQYRSISELQQLRSYYKRIVNMQIKMMGGKGGTYAIQHIYPENRTIGSPWYGGFPPPVRS